MTGPVPAGRPGEEPGAPRERAGLVRLVKDLVSFDRRTVWILLYVPLALTVLEYVFVPATATSGRAPAIRTDAVRWLQREFASVPYGLWPWLWWAGGCLVFFVLLPMTLLRLAAGTRPSDVGLKVKGTLPDARVYALLFAAFAPVVWLVSKRPDFLDTYPFYRPFEVRSARGAPLGWDFVAFEAAYFVQFLGVEYFFRGVMVLGLKPALGKASILVMLAPYCMIHYHKPMLEAFGAVGAGAVLGCLSWRTGTVVYGWFLHYSVALSMDLLSLSQHGLL